MQNKRGLFSKKTVKEEVKMGKYVLKRFGAALLSLFIIITLIFCLLRLMPIEGYLGPNVDKLSEEVIAAKLAATEKLQRGESVGYCKSWDELGAVTAKLTAQRLGLSQVGAAAERLDQDAAAAQQCVRSFRLQVRTSRQNTPRRSAAARFVQGAP